MCQKRLQMYFYRHGGTQSGIFYSSPATCCALNPRYANKFLEIENFLSLVLVAAREELRAEEFTKFQAALMWSKKYCDSNPVRMFVALCKALEIIFDLIIQNTQLKEIFNTFLGNIFFHKIPANVLMREIYPLNVVPANIIMNA